RARPSASPPSHAARSGAPPRLPCRRCAVPWRPHILMGRPCEPHPSPKASRSERPVVSPPSKRKKPAEGFHTPFRDLRLPPKPQPVAPVTEVTLPAPPKPPSPEPLDPDAALFL